MMLDNDWQEVLGDQFEQPYFLELKRYLEQEYQEHTVFPAKEDVFRAFRSTPYQEVKAVILGQDPYHGAGQAHGLSFSVKSGVNPPPSLRNIFRELSEDIGCPVPKDGCLQSWADQGVLLLNTVLTVREGQAYSHKGKGWETFTDACIEALNRREEPVAFVLWGKPAQEKGAKVDESRHLVIRSPHPSPLSAHRGFFGSRPFSRINAWLTSQGRSPIRWDLS